MSTTFDNHDEVRTSRARARIISSRELAEPSTAIVSGLARLVARPPVSLCMYVGMVRHACAVLPASVWSNTMRVPCYATISSEGVLALPSTKG